MGAHEQLVQIIDKVIDLHLEDAKRDELLHMITNYGFACAHEYGEHMLEVLKKEGRLKY